MPEDPVAIEVNDRAIRLSELQAQIDSLLESGAPITSNPERFLTGYIDRQIALHEALARGLDNDPELRRQWENLLIGRLYRDLPMKPEEITIPEEAILQYYNEHIAEYTTHAKIRVALLRLKYDSPTDEGTRREQSQALKEAYELARELPEETKGFGSLAMRYSDEGTSRFKGGDIGWLQAGRANYRWPEAVIAAMFALGPEDLYSPVIETPDACYLLKYLDGRPEVSRPLNAQLSNAIKRKLRTAAITEQKTSLATAWSEASQVEIFQDVVSRLRFTSPEYTSISFAEPGQTLPQSPTPLQ